jgi:hypothetical protein
MKILESFVYIKTQQGNNAIDSAVNSIATLDGVMSANINRNVSGVMNIEHDPTRISGSNIIDYLKTNGYSSYQFGF